MLQDGDIKIIGKSAIYFYISTSVVFLDDSQGIKNTLKP